MSSTNLSSPTPPAGRISTEEIVAIRAAWLLKANDIGLGLYNISTGEIHVGTFDTTGLRIGHDGLQLTLGIPDAERSQWRGFVFSSAGQVINQSGFNIPDGTPPRMSAPYFSQVEDELRHAGLI